jgi:hypothetical protein
VSSGSSFLLGLAGGRRRGGGEELKKRRAAARGLGEAEGKIKKEKVRVFNFLTFPVLFVFSTFLCFDFFEF